MRVQMTAVYMRGKTRRITNQSCIQELNVCNFDKEETKSGGENFEMQVIIS